MQKEVPSKLKARIIAACGGARLGKVEGVAATDIATVFEVTFRAPVPADALTPARLSGHGLKWVPMTANGDHRIEFLEVPLAWLEATREPDSQATDVNDTAELPVVVIPHEPVTPPVADPALEFVRLREKAERDALVIQDLLHLAGHKSASPVEIRTLVQSLDVPERIRQSDSELSNALNDGWEILNWSDKVNSRIVALKRAKAEDTRKDARAVREAEAVVSAAFDAAPEAETVHIIRAVPVSVPVGEFTRAILQGGKAQALEESNARVLDQIKQWYANRPTPVSAPVSLIPPSPFVALPEVSSHE